jgi:hypothetical protein
MTAEQIRLTATVEVEHDRQVLETHNFVPVAIPEKLHDARTLKSDLEAWDIPAFLEMADMDEDILGGVPVLVPECSFEKASHIVGMIELNARDDEDVDEFEDDDDEVEEFEDEDDDEDDEDFDDEDDEEEDEDDEEDEADDFETLDDDDDDELE